MGKCAALFFLALLWAYSIRGAQVEWRPNTSFNLALNFADGERPCGLQTVHFPERLISTVQIASTNDMASLMLPIDGELQLNEGASINFGNKIQNTKEVCAQRDNYYIEKTNFAWLQADVWESHRFSAATPDAQRVPCFDDDVIFPEDSQFSVKLPGADQYVRSVTIRGTPMDSTTLKSFVESSETGTQSFILNEFMSVGVIIQPKSCPSRAGCPCQENSTIVDCSVKVCDIPKCTEPVMPRGNCCPICGGVLEFDINVSTFKYMSFKKNVAEIVDASSGRERIIYHVGLLWRDRVQVVMVERAEYDGSSALAMHTLARGLGEDVAPSFKQILLSGTPLSMVGINGRIVGFAFFAVGIVFVSVYLWYQRPDLVRALPLTQIGLQNANIFSRLPNRQNSITSLVSQGSVAFRSSFRNPLFFEKEKAESSTAGPRRNVYNESELKHAEEVAAAETSLCSATLSDISLVPDLE